eukprot:8550480-Pyramimonas_sp.AAC.1
MRSRSHASSLLLLLLLLYLLIPSARQQKQKARDPSRAGKQARQPSDSDRFSNCRSPLRGEAIGFSPLR